MNSFSFLSGNLFICPLILNDGFVGQSNLGCRSLLFMILNISCQSFLACEVSFGKSAGSPMGTHLQVTKFFSFAFKILFIFNLWHFNYDVSWYGPLWVQFVWDWIHCASWTCMSFSFTELGKFSLFFQISFQIIILFLPLFSPL